ncbi:MAG TPA: hypothetical protein VF553_17215 [Pyrinomonadaceae bacterium]|jgi:hypothetical protein
MRRKTRITLCCFLWATLLFASASSSHAQLRTVEDYGRAVRNGTGATYFDLLRKIFPDAEMGAASSQEATGHLTMPLNHLDGEYRNRVYRAALKINAIESLFLQTGGGRQLLLLVHAQGDDAELTWGELGILALFELEPQVRLLDAADIKADRFSSFWEEQPLLHIGPQADAVMIANYHHNSSQGYLSLTLVSTQANRLRTIFELPTLLNLNYCGNNSTQTPSLAVLKSLRGGHFDISLKIRLVKKADDESCAKATGAYKREFKTVLVWSRTKRKYQSTGRALTVLAALNERNF